MFSYKNELISVLEELIYLFVNIFITKYEYVVFLKFYYCLLIIFINIYV